MHPELNEIQGQNNRITQMKLYHLLTEEWRKTLYTSSIEQLNMKLA